MVAQWKHRKGRSSITCALADRQLHFASGAIVSPIKLQNWQSLRVSHGCVEGISAILFRLGRELPRTESISDLVTESIMGLMEST
jgi:hypothetical protein